MATSQALLLLLLLLVAVERGQAPPSLLAGRSKGWPLVTDPRYVPAFHQRPPCYNGQGPKHVGAGQSPHDIAAALFLPETKTWHVMAGCWQYPLGGWRTNLGGWQHMTSLAWRSRGRSMASSWST